MEAINEILSLGWYFNNCYQTDDGVWRVNLRRPDGEGEWFTDWAEAETFEEALDLCRDKLEQAEYIAAVKQGWKASTEGTMQSILAALVKPQEPLRRRR